jgi:transcription antitermination factor NusG
MSVQQLFNNSDTLSQPLQSGRHGDGGSMPQPTPTKSRSAMNWYCVHTKPQKEHLVAAFLQENLGLETYFPRLRQQKTIRRVRRVVTSPLFPRYLFSRFDPSSHYRPVRYAPEMIDVVNFGGRPAVVGDSMIDELRIWAGEEVDLITLQPDFRPGDRVEIIDGPMRGLPAIILHSNNDSDRVAVLLSLLESSAHLHINRSQLARAV